MQFRRVRWLLLTTGIGLHVASAVAVACAFFWPCTPHSAQDSLSPLTGPPDGAQQPPAHEPTDFEPLWIRRFRDPLLGTSTVAAMRSGGQDEDSLLNLRLLGTILEPGRSLAIFSTSPTAIELKAIGETVGDASFGAEVLVIESKHVVLRHEGSLVTLEIPEATGE